MKSSKTFLVVIVLGFFVFSSCSKEEDGVVEYGGKARLLFGTVLNDLITKAREKQAIPFCSEQIPAFVEVVLSGPTNVGSISDPLVVSVNPVPGNFDGESGAEFFTNESLDLELDPGTYTLEYFAVYDGDPTLEESKKIWIAPRKDGSLADFVDVALPMDFNLRAGAKKYLDVEVLCYDEKLANEYGYLFFNVEPRRAVEFCFFANYCPGGGRDFPAAYSVDVYLGTNNSAPLLYSSVVNNTWVENEVPYAEPLCLPLPDLNFPDDEDYLYYEVTLLEWDEVYEYIETASISNTLSRNDIEGNFGPNNTVDFEHLRFGCETQCPSGTVDTDKDGVPDECDPCPLISAGLDNDDDCIPNNEDPCPDNPENDCETEEPCAEEKKCEGTETAWMWGDHTLTKKDNDGLSLSGKWGWAEEFFVGQTDSSFSFYAGAGNNNTSNGFLAGEVQVSVSGTTVTVYVDAQTGVQLDKLDIYVNDSRPETASPGQFKFYGGLSDDDPCSGIINSYSFEYSGDGSFWIMVHGDVCLTK